MLKKTRRVLAITIIVLALLVLAGRVSIAHLTQQTHYFEVLASKALGYPVAIQSVSTSWRGFHPLFVLNNVLVKEDDETLLQVKQLMVGADFLSSLWHWEFIPGTLEVKGAAVSVFQDEAGHWQISGFADDGKQHGIEFNRWLRWLLSEKRISLSDIHIEIKRNNKNVVPLHVSHVELFAVGDSTRIEGDASFDQPQPATLHLMAELNRSFSSDSAKAKIYLDAKNIDLASWFNALIFDKWQIKQGHVNAQVWANWQNKQWASVQVLFSGKDVAVKNETQTYALSFAPINLLVQQVKKDVWQWHGLLSKLKVNQQTLIQEPFDFIYQQDNLQQQIQITDVSFALINNLAAQFPNLPKDQLLLLKKLNVTGHLHDVYFKKDDKTWLLDGDVKNTNSQPEGKIPGAVNLSGHFQVTPTEGFFDLASEKLSVTFPKVFRKTIELDEAVGSAHWKLLPNEGLVVNVDNAQASNEDGLCFGRFSLVFTKGNSHPWISLVGGGRLKTLNRESLYLPYSVMPPEVLAWIDQAVVPGAAKTNATVVLNGPLEHFPFDDHQGQFTVDADLENVDLQFGKGWPVIQGLSGNIVFNDRAMSFKNGTGKIYKDTTLQDLSVSIPAMGAPGQPTILNVGGNAQTTMQDALQYIKQSPLNEILKYRFSDAQGEGAFNLALKLVLPLSDSEVPTQVTGDATFSHDKLGIDPVYVENLTGGLHFTEESMAAPLLTGSLFNYPLKITINNFEKPDWIQTQVKTTGTFSTALLEKMKSKFLVTNYISGSSAFISTFNLYHARADKIAPPDELQIQSDLTGISINLPAPFNKDKNTSQPSQLTVQWRDAGPVFNFKSSNNFQALLALKGRPLVFDRGVIALNVANVQLPNESGLLVAGNLPTLDWEAWQTVIDQTSDNKTTAKTKLTFPTFLRKIDLTIGKVALLGREWLNTNIQLIKGQNGIVTQIKNEILAGQIIFSEKLDTLRIRLDYLSVPDVSGTKNNFSPKTIPGLDFYSRSVRIGKKNLGEVGLVTSRTRSGLSIDRLSIGSGAYQLTAHGYWNDGIKPISNLSGNISSQNLARMLQEWDLSPGIISNNASGNFSLTWQGTPFDFNVATLSGSFGLDIKNGTFTDLGTSTNLKVGLGRIITLLSVQSLTQKLQLNFSDMTHSGFNFNVFKGQFTIYQGQASTSNVLIDGPVAKIKLQGRVGLATHDYDLQLGVTPYVTASLPVIATIAGGPVVGAVAWLTDKVLSPAVQKLTTYHYHLTGPWDKPTVAPE